MTMDLVDRAFGPLAPLLVDGLTEDQRVWAESSLREVVLPPRVHVKLTGSAALDWADHQGAQLAAALRPLTPVGRWAHLVEQHYGSALAPLDAAAMRCAALAAASGDDGPDEFLRGEAQTVEQRLDALEAEMREASPQTAEDLQDAVSEARLDCQYVTKGPSYRSRRMVAMVIGTRWEPERRADSDESDPLGADGAPGLE